jgi:unsaturated rhamnogalacturonyl hydrolase
LLFLAILSPATGAAGSRDPWTAVADRLLQTPPESYAFNWGEGVQMIGLMKAFERTGNAAYADYVARWAAVYAPRSNADLLGLKGDRTGYCGYWSPSTALLYLYQARHNPEHLRLAKMSLDFIRDGAERGPEGGLGHWLGSHQLWVDTLYMACPLLAGMGHLENKPALIQDSADQIIVFARHLQDGRTGLFYHMWDWQTGEHSEGLWGRGNGWVLMSLADTMEVLPKSDPKYRQLERILQRLSSGLAATQDAGGLWHTVLDDPGSYPECSATAMFTYGLLKLARLHVLPAANKTAALAAWKAINDRYVHAGVVNGVSGGTGPRGIEAYRTVRVGSETWGTGAYLMAAGEVAADREGKKK